jgi:uncharacterized protein (TIGR04255 family)
MAAQRHLSRAPAREALIDIQFEPRVPLEVIERFVAVAEPKFTRKFDLWEAFFGLNADGGPPKTNASRSAIGKRLDLDNPPHVLQCRVDGFTFSRLSPYGEWMDLRDEARRWWLEFQSIVQPRTVTRIAVRYINEIKLPLPINDFADFLTCPPKVPEALPQGISSFLHRVIIPDEPNNCVSIVTQALEGQSLVGAEAATATILLDVDVFRTVRLEGDQIDDIWIGLDVLRNQKNRMFFEHITEKTVGMFV